jgi:hypothetical protein
MMKSLRFRSHALAVAILLPFAQAQAAAPSWVERSNANATTLLTAIGTFSPEEASGYGLQAYDTKISDLALGYTKRANAALSEARETLNSALSKESDPQVRQDLEILIHACDLRIESNSLNDRLLLTYVDVGQLVFSAEFQLLQDQVSAARRVGALARLNRYTGIEPGTTPVTKLAEALFEESMRDPSRLGPFKGKVQDHLSNTSNYVSGIRKLYAKYAVAGGGPALDAFEMQMKEYDAWTQKTVFAHSREDFREPPEIYANDLKNVGLGISPEELIHKAELEYTETQNELKAIAPLVAKEHGLTDADYRSVIKELKKDQMGPEQIEPYYHEVIAKIEETVREERIIALPDRALVMRIASAAETAAQPAPHYQPPPLIDNTGERGQFVLPLGNPKGGGDPKTTYDDFTFKAAAWTLSAHEGRPGHDLQFTAMLERGVSLTRSIFAFNSVNVEGWALYSEAEFKPFEPLDGQMIALQLRLLRAARAILDPMLNLGLISKDRAHDILIRDVGLSEAFTGEELDRFTFRSPGQATSYFYGYSRLMELRAAAEIELGPKFDRYAFNNFIIGQGLLPPDVIAEAVEKDFIPSQRK